MISGLVLIALPKSLFILNGIGYVRIMRLFSIIIGAFLIILGISLPLLMKIVDNWH